VDDIDQEWKRLVETYGPRQAVRFALNGERRWKERVERERVAKTRKAANAKLKDLAVVNRLVKKLKA